jgi:hypothetical protein
MLMAEKAKSNFPALKNGDLVSLHVARPQVKGCEPAMPSVNTCESEIGGTLEQRPQISPMADFF